LKQILVSKNLLPLNVPGSFDLISTIFFFGSLRSLEKHRILQVELLSKPTNIVNMKIYSPSSALQVIMRGDEQRVERLVG
jgi:hypothetical protein